MNLKVHYTVVYINHAFLFFVFFSFLFMHACSYTYVNVYTCTYRLAGFTIPPNYSAKQIYQAIKAPTWTWDFISNDPYSHACIDTEVPADFLEAFVNSQINPAFNWGDAVSMHVCCNTLYVKFRESIRKYVCRNTLTFELSVFLFLGVAHEKMGRAYSP